MEIENAQLSLPEDRLKITDLYEVHVMYDYKLEGKVPTYSTTEVIFMSVENGLKGINEFVKNYANLTGQKDPMVYKTIRLGQLTSLP